MSRSKKRRAKKLLVIQAPSDVTNYLLAEVRKNMTLTIVRATTMKRTADWFRQQANTCENSAVMDAASGKVLFIGQARPFIDEVEDNFDYHLERLVESSRIPIIGEEPDKNGVLTIAEETVNRLVVDLDECLLRDSDEIDSLLKAILIVESVKLVEGAKLQAFVDNVCGRTFLKDDVIESLNALMTQRGICKPAAT